MLFFCSFYLKNPEKINKSSTIVFNIANNKKGFLSINNK